MKTNKIILTAALIAASFTSFAQVGVGTTSPDANASLHVSETEETVKKGLLLPRVTDAQMGAMADVAGMMVYCTDCAEPGVYVNDGSGYSPSAGSGGSGTGTGDSSVTNNCDTNGLVGTFVNGVALSGASFSVTITNNTFSTAAITFAAGDLVLSGVTGISVGAPSPASVSLTAGQSQLVTYSLSGTPASIGTLTAAWSKLSLSCTKTKNVTNGGATFTLPQSKYAVSINDGTPLVDIQGVIDNTTNQFVINVPYTSGAGSYDAFSGAVVVGAAGEAGDTNGFSIAYPANTFAANGTIPVTVTVDGDGSYNAKKQLFGVEEDIVTLPFMVNGNAEGNIVLKVIGGVPDVAFGDGTHDFIYIPVTNTITNKTWLNNNLGANYANMNHGSFDPVQQATAHNDADAYGSYYQWGRGTDGHELDIPSNNVSGTSTATTPTAAQAGKFLTGSNNWYTGTNPDDLWKTDGTGINNPCPQGYRVPTTAELDAERLSWTPTNSAGAAAGTLKLPAAGFRNYSSGSLINVGTRGFYWSSTVNSGTSASSLSFPSSSASMGTSSRANGNSVRCIKE